MRLKIIIASLFIVIQAHAVQVTDENKKLGFCEFVYFYSAQSAQMQNNEGLAKSYLRRASMLTVANFMLMEQDGVISNEKIKATRAESLLIKPKFDINAKLVLSELAKCDSNSLPIASKIRDSNKKLWNKNYDELQQELFNQNLLTLGIK